MKKIEKLELPYDDGKGNFSSGSGEIHILRKVNEIIDVLNSWVFEPTLTIPSQSQKQPKGETIRNYNPEKRWDKYKKSKIEVREFDLVPKVQPEKQEEWREKIKQMVLTDCFKDQPDIQRYIDFIEQLLSEKTFSKEELEFLQCVLNDNETVRYYSNGGDGYIGEYIEPILEKISKLLEEENEK